VNDSQVPFGGSCSLKKSRRLRRRAILKIATDKQADDLKKKKKGELGVIPLVSGGLMK
jgi:hypothetical protein